MKEKPSTEKIIKNIFKGWGRDILLVLLVIVISYITTKITVKSNKEIEKLKYKQETIRDIIVSQNISDARKKIKFLLESKLIIDENREISDAFNDLIDETKAHELYLQGNRLSDSAFNSVLENSMKLKLFNNSINKYTESIENNPFISNTYHARGYSYQKMAFLSDQLDMPYCFKESINNFNTAIQIDSMAIHSYYLRGLSEQNLGSLNDAEDDYLIAINLDSSIVEPYFYLGIIYLQKQDFLKAEHYISKSINNNLLITRDTEIVKKMILETFDDFTRSNKLNQAEFIQNIHDKYF